MADSIFETGFVISKSIVETLVVSNRTAHAKKLRT